MLGKLFTRGGASEPAESRTITELFGMSGSDLSLLSGGSANLYGGAMKIPGLWRGANLIAGMLGGLPWDAYRERAGLPVAKLTPRPPMLEQPAPPETRVTTFASLGLDYLMDGNAVAIVAARNVEGWPTAFVPVPARIVGVRRVGPYDPKPVGPIEYNVGGQVFGGHDVLHVKGPCEPGALRGLGILEAHLDDTLSLVREQQRQARSLSQHGVPTGLLKASSPDVTREQLIEAKAKWQENQRDRTIQALAPGTDFEPLSWNPEEMQLVEARRYSLTDLELILGLPVGWLGGMNSARQYSNIEQDAVNLLKFSLGDHLMRFEAAVSAHMPRGTVAKANLDALLRNDTLARYQAHAIALDKGILTVAEVRALEDLPPLPADEQPPAPLLALPKPDENDDEGDLDETEAS